MAEGMSNMQTTDGEADKTFAKLILSRASAEDIAGYRQLVMPITVVALLPPDHCGNRDELGLHCQAKRGMQIIELPLADVELTHNTPNSRLLDDYWYWFWNWRFDPLVD